MNSNAQTYDVGAASTASKAEPEATGMAAGTYYIPNSRHETLLLEKLAEKRGKREKKQDKRNLDL